MSFTTLRKIFLTLIVAGLAFVPAAAQAQSDWGPDRPTFTWANPATYVTFNSITDNPVVGDERRFFTGYDSNVGSGSANHNVNVTNNEEVTLRLYYHNNAAANLNLIAFDTKVKIALPSTAASSQSTVATISAANSNPLSVFDTVHLTGAQPFTLSYEPGTAKLFNQVFNGTPLSDSIVTSSGAPIGFNQIDGKVPGCANFSGWVTIKARVQIPTPPTPPVTPPVTPPTTPPITPPATTTTAPKAPKPPAPTALVNTGPGSDAAIFALATVAGTIGYRYFLSRRLSRQ